jgi:hypothetical protein
MRKSCVVYWILEMLVYHKHFNSILALELRSTEKCILMALVMRSDDKNKCWPSIETIALDSGFGRTAVVKAISGMVKSGLLIRQNRQRKSTVYTIVIDETVLSKVTSRTSSPDVLVHPETPHSSPDDSSKYGRATTKSTIKNTYEEYNEDENPFNGKPAKVDPLSESSLKATFVPFVMIGLKTQEEDLILIRECVNLCGGIGEAAKAVVKIKDRVTKNTKYDRIFPSVFLAEVRAIQGDKAKSDREAFDKEYAEAEFMALHTEKLIAANKKAEEAINAPF